MGMNMTEKILARSSGRSVCHPGEIVEANVDVVMLHDVGTPGIHNPLKELGVEKLPSSVEVVIIPDHFSPAPTVKGAENLKLTREFARKHRIKNYYGLVTGPRSLTYKSIFRIFNLPKSDFLLFFLFFLLSCVRINHRG
jgi:homoaconitase/3-isopropylmalate dehydratase large subunit